VVALIVVDLRPRGVRVDLGGRVVHSFGDRGAETKFVDRHVDHTILGELLLKKGAVGVGRGNVGYFLDRVDDGRVKIKRGVVGLKGASEASAGIMVSNIYIYIYIDNVLLSLRSSIRSSLPS